MNVGFSIAVIQDLTEPWVINQGILY